MISHYTSIVFIVAFAMSIMIVSVSGNKFMPFEKRLRFILLFLLLIFVNLAEWLAASINGGYANLRALHIAAKFTEFMLTPIIPALCVLALGGYKRLVPFNIMICVNVVTQIVSLFTGIIFWVDADSVYHRGDAYIIYAAIVALGMVLLLIYGVFFSKQYQYQSVAFLSLIMLLAMLGMASQMVHSSLRLDWVCASISAIMFYIYYDQLVQQTDDLTTLLNRRSYESQVARLRKRAVILFFDVDHFKNVNDTYGHSYGDVCLKRLAVDVKRVFGKYGECFRFGGDEFCVIMTRKGEDVSALISAYLRAVNVLREADARIPYVSIGYTAYDPASEAFPDAIARADAMMYQYKAAHRETELTST